MVVSPEPRLRCRRFLKLAECLCPSPNGKGDRTMNIVRTWAEMRRIYGFCPCCDEVFRLSEVDVFTKTAPSRTEFDRLDAAVERFDQRQDAIRADAREKGQRAALRRLRRLAPLFPARDVRLHEVKVLFHPVEFVAFRGLSDDRCSAIVFVDRPAESSRRERLQQSLRRAIRAGNLEWQTLRVDADFKINRENNS
jgi:predicted Holliday junction resolvase-like endonuclease